MKKRLRKKLAPILAQRKQHEQDVWERKLVDLQCRLQSLLEDDLHCSISDNIRCSHIGSKIRYTMIQIDKCKRHINESRHRPLQRLLLSNP